MYLFYKFDLNQIYKSLKIRKLVTHDFKIYF